MSETRELAAIVAEDVVACGRPRQRARGQGGSFAVASGDVHPQPRRLDSSHTCEEFHACFSIGETEYAVIAMFGVVLSPTKLQVPWPARFEIERGPSLP